MDILYKPLGPKTLTEPVPRTMHNNAACNTNSVECVSCLRGIFKKAAKQEEGELPAEE